MISKKIFIVMILISIIFVGCAASTASLNSYVDPSFSRENISSIAIFPIMNTKFAPSEARQINRKVSQSIVRKNKNINIVSSNEAINLLNKNDLSSEWAIFLDNYNSSGIPDSRLLNAVGEILEVDAILQGEIVNIFQEDGHYGGNKGTTRVSVRFSMMSTKNW